MTRIAIVTDSTADLPKHIAKQHDIIVAPLKINFGEESFLDGIEISAEEFYSRMKETEITPTTSQVSVGNFVEIYEKLKEKADIILSIHISERMSGTYQAAVLAANEVSGVDIVPINSRTVSASLGFQVLFAAEEVRKGSSKEDILKKLEALQEKQKIYFSVATLEYLERGGRIGKAQALVGNLLNIKPLLTVDLEGVVAPLEKIRGRKKVFRRLVELYGEFIRENGPDCYQAIMHGADQKTADALKKEINEKYGEQNIDTFLLGPVVGTHAGPGTVGMVLTPRL